MSMVTDESAVYKTNKSNEMQLKPEGTGEKISNEQLVSLIRSGENEADNML